MEHSQSRYCYVHPHPAVTTDVVIMTIRDKRLMVLLIKRKSTPFQGMWALPGGFVNLNEDLAQGALRELKEETSVQVAYLEQLYTFGAPTRDPRERVISVAYYALIPSDSLKLRAATDAQAVAWFAMENLPHLAFDHTKIIAVAQQRLVAKLDYSTIAFQFMPREFTLSELQGVYELILDEALDKRNFRKWVLALEQIQETGTERKLGAHRPARLYRVINPDKVEIIK